MTPGLFKSVNMLAVGEGRSGDTNLGQRPDVQPLAKPVGCSGWLDHAEVVEYFHPKRVL